MQDLKPHWSEHTVVLCTWSGRCSMDFEYYSYLEYFSPIFSKLSSSFTQYFKLHSIFSSPNFHRIISLYCQYHALLPYIWLTSLCLKLLWCSQIISLVISEVVFVIFFFKEWKTNPKTLGRLRLNDWSFTMNVWLYKPVRMKEIICRKD